MTSIEWTDELSIGVAEIDRQHKELFAQVNRLLDACHQARGKEAVAGIIAFLGDYVVRHFAAEEEYMARCGYQGLEPHRAEHRQFIERFAALRQRFEAEGPGVHIVVMVNNIVVNWLNKHIRNVDRAMGKFLRNRARPLRDDVHD